jgi:hypothetical protein
LFASCNAGLSLSLQAKQARFVRDGESIAGGGKLLRKA